VKSLFGFARPRRQAAHGCGEAEPSTLAPAIRDPENHKALDHQLVRSRWAWHPEATRGVESNPKSKSGRKFASEMRVSSPQ
jgi:hypothetical protein